MSENSPQLSEVCAQVLEQHAFMFAGPDPGPVPDHRAAPMLMLTIHFSGPVRGKLELVVPEEMGATLAANLLGIEPAEALAQGEDALKELLNIMCGQVLTAFHGSGAVFELSIPLALKIDKAAVEGFGAMPGTVRLVADDVFAVWACYQVVGVGGGA